MLNWTQQFNIFCLLDNQDYNSSSTAFDCLLAAGAESSISVETGSALEALDQFILQKQDWLFGHLAYDLKNEIESLSSLNEDGIEFPELHFFVPEIIVRCIGDLAEIGTRDIEASSIFDEINNSSCSDPEQKIGLTVSQRFSKEEYLQTVRKIQEHIHRGDCYELNFCQEFFLKRLK